MPGGVDDPEKVDRPRPTTATPPQEAVRGPLGGADASPSADSTPDDDAEPSTPMEEFDLDEALAGLSVEEVRPILDLIEGLWPSAKEAAAKAFSRFPIKFARFRVERELGRGGFGVVFEAYDPVLGRNVALKLPRPEVLLTPGLSERFYAEARASAGLSHPNVVQVHEAGEYGPTCYIVSELCRGPTLREWLAGRTSPVDPTDAARFVLALADAVAYAQRLGVLHRDIKPSNVLMVKPPPEWELAGDAVAASIGYIPKLTDFGLAKMLEEESTHTPAGTVVGTPEYMAPEQAEGRVEDINASTDVYGLGAVLYEILVGRPAIEGSTAVDKLRRVLLQDPTDPRKSRRDIPRDLEAIVMRCLRKDARGRYVDAEDLASDLRHFLAGEPTKARPLRPGQKLWKWGARHPTEATLAGVVTVFVAIAGMLGWLHQETVDKAEARANQASQVAEDHERTARLEHDKLMDLRFAADLRDAHGAIESGQMGRAIEVLNRHLPGGEWGDRRSFAWRLLWRRCHQESARLDLHPNAVYGLSFSPDGERLASGGLSGDLLITDLKTGQTQTVAPAHRSDLNEVHYSADGRWLVSSGDDGTLLVRDGAGVWQRTILVCAGRVFSMRLHPTLPLAVTADEDRQCEVWNLETGACSRQWETTSRTLEAVGFTPDGRGMVTADADGRVCYAADFLTSSLDEVARVSGASNALATLAGEPDGRPQVLVCGRNRQVTLIDLTTGRTVRQWLAHRDWAQGLAISADGQWCVTVGRDKVAKIWEVSSGRLLTRIVGHQERLWNVAIHPDGQRLATCSGDRSIRIWERNRSGDSVVLARWPRLPVGLAAGPGVKQVVTASAEGELAVWDVPRQEKQFSWMVEGPVVSVDAALGGPIAVASSSGKVLLFPWGEERGTGDQLSVDVDSPVDVALSADGAMLSVTDAAGEVHLFRVESKGSAVRVELVGRVPMPEPKDHWVWSKFSPDGRSLVTASPSAVLKCWTVPGLAWVRTEHRQHPVKDLAFDAHADAMVSVSAEPTTLIDSVPHGTRLASLMSGDSAGHSSVVFSGDGKNLLLGQSDGTLSVWDLVVHQEIFHDRTPLEDVLQMAMTFNGEQLLLLGRDRLTGEALLLVRSAKVRDRPTGELPLGASPSER